MADIRKFEINGLIDTSENVLDNINKIAKSSGCFVTWDPSEGQWSIIENTTGTSVQSFNDSNIIGNISVSGSAIAEMYNGVSISFPNKDIRDTIDRIDINVSSSELYANEIENILNLEISCINDPVQAQYIASRELKQSRVDKIIQFRTDFVANELKAGDLIDVTVSAYDYTNKVFRILEIEETDDDDGSLVYSITGLEYDADVYSDAGLSRKQSSKFTGVKSKLVNQQLQQQDDIDLGLDVGKLLAANAALGLINSFFETDPNTGEIFNAGQFSNQTTNELMSAATVLPPLTHSASDIDLCSPENVRLDLSYSCSSCFFNSPDFTYEYQITGLLQTEIDIPLEGTVVTSGNSASLTFRVNVEEAKSFNITVGSTTTTFNAYIIPDQYIFGVGNATTVVEGSSVDVPILTYGYNDGDTLSYTITGTGTDKVTIPLTGTVTLSRPPGFDSAAATLTITTQDDSVFGEDQEITVAFTPNEYSPCLIEDNNTVTITIRNNDVTGPDPGPDPGDPEDDDYFCEFVEVPLIYCGRFDNDNQYLKSVSVLKTVLLPKAPTGGLAVPLTVSVTDPESSSAAISIDSTVNVEPSGIGASGMTVEVITAFDPVPAGGDTLITGTTSTLQGYFG